MSDHPKEHGLLFKPDMVKAYFAGLKSMTRRVITRQNSYIDGGPAYRNIWDGLELDRAWIDPGPSPAGNTGPYLKVPRRLTENGEVVDELVHRVYPRYQAGDTLWGREGWAVGKGYDGLPPRELPQPHRTPINKCYRADPETEWSSTGRGQWRSPLYMPRWMARIVAPIVAVRPERLQNIAQPEDIEDVFSEGLSKQAFMYYDEEGGKDLDTDEALEAFRELWDSINGDRYPWGSNPWVWAITFKRYEEAAGA